MRLANIEANGLSRVAIISSEEVVDLTAHLGVQIDDVPKLLSLGSEVFNKRALLTAPRLALSEVTLRAPILQADKLFGVGMNYHSFVSAAQRLGMVIPQHRFWFQRPRGCITGPYGDIWLPYGATDLDYEAELALVIGKRCRDVSARQAPDVIAGYTIANDLTLRQRIIKSIVLGKSFDTHTPLGPWIVTADEIGDPHCLGLKTWINGELRQESNTSDMIASCYELVEEMSYSCTLNPGDIILTGTPDGSGIFQEPPTGLKVGDVVKIEIEGIGTIENRVVDEPEHRART